MASRPTEEELLSALDDFADVIPEQVRRPGKRSSILKQPKNFEDLCLTEDLNRRKSYSKRVSFADKFQVMELCTGNIYDVPGKSVSASDSAINPDISSDTKPEASSKENIEQITRIQVQVPLPSSDFEMQYEKYSLTNTTRKHKMDFVDETEPERKKLNALERSSLGNNTSVQNMVAEFNNYMLKFSQNDDETMVNQDMKLAFARSVNINSVVKENLILNKTDDSIAINESQRVLNLPKSQIHERNNFLSDSVISASKCNITPNLGDSCVYDTVSKQMPNMRLFPVSLSSIPLEENKENIYVDEKNKEVLVTSGRHFKLKELTPVSDAVPDFKDVNAPVPVKTAVQRSMISDSPPKDKKKSNFDKTYLFNQSMDLTCVIPELDKFHGTESSIQSDFLKPDTNLPSAENCEIAHEELNNSHSMFPDCKFKMSNKCLNKTKLNICDMDLTTCYAGSNMPFVKDKSFTEYDPPPEIFCDTKRPNSSPTLFEIVSKESSTDVPTKLVSGSILYSSSTRSLMLKKLNHVPTGKENILSSSDILCCKSQNSAQIPVKEKSAFDKTILFNQSMDLSGMLSSDIKQSDSSSMISEIVSEDNLSNDVLTKFECEPTFDSNSIKSLIPKKLDNFPTGKENFIISSDILCDKLQNSTQVQVLKQNEKSVWDKTFVFNQSMDLTCIVSESNKLNNSECSIQPDFLSVKNAASEIKNKINNQEISDDPINTIHSIPFKRPDLNLNKTKLSTYDMELTFAAESHSVENLSVEDASFAKYDSISETLSSDTKNQPIHCSMFPEIVLKDSLSKSHNDLLNKSACIPVSNSLPTKNLAQKKHSIVSLEKENLENHNFVTFDSKFQNSGIENKIGFTSAPVSLSIMELTCNVGQSHTDSSIEEVNTESSHITDLQEDDYFPKMTENGKSILMQNGKTVDFEQNNKTKLGKMDMELTCHNKVFKSDTLIFPKDDAKTKHFTFDAMELTCLGKNDIESEKYLIGEKSTSIEVGKDTLKRKSDELDDKDYKFHKISPLDSHKDFVSAKEQFGVIFKKNIEDESEFENSRLMFKNGVCASSTKMFNDTSDHYISDLQIDSSLKCEKEMVSNNAAIKPHSFIFSQTVAPQKNDIRSDQLLKENCAVNEIRLPSDSSSEVLSPKNFLKSELGSISFYKTNTINDKATLCFTSDLMELTNWSKSQVLDQTSKRVDSLKVGKKTQYFCSDVMELTCNAKNQCDRNSLISDTTALKLCDKSLSTNYGETLKSCGFSKSKNIGENNCVSHLQVDVDFVAVPQTELSKPPVQKIQSVSDNLESSNCFDVIHKQQATSKERYEGNTPLSLKSSDHINNEEKGGNFVGNSTVVGSVASESKKMYESAKSGIVYAIKKLKSMNHFSDTDGDFLKFPEVFLSLRKQPKPITSFSCTKIELSNAVQNAIRKSCSFNYDSKELSFTAEIDVRQSSRTNKYQRLSRNDETVRVSEVSFTDLESVFIPEYSENIERFVKNDTDVISSKKCELHNSFTEENIELISDSILNDISITKNDTNSINYRNLASDNLKQKSNSSLQPEKASLKKNFKNQDNYDNLNTPAKLNFEISVGMLATPENIHKTIVLPEEKLYDDHTLDEVIFKGMTNQTQDMNKDVCENRIPMLLAPNLDKSLLGDSKAKVENPINHVQSKDLPTPSTQIAFDSTERSDSAKYTLTLPASSREDSAATAIVPPTAPETMQLNNVTKDGCTILWTPSKADGGSEIIHYVIEIKDTETGKWVMMGESFNPQIRADKLIEGHEYSFRVKAVNKVGESPWLFGKESVVAKNPYVAPNIDISPLGSSKAVNLMNEIPIKEGQTPTTQIAFDATERSDSADYLLTVPTTSREDPATAAIDDPRLISSSDMSDEVLQKITLWRRKFIEASHEEDHLWRFKEMDDNAAVFTLMRYSRFGAYFMRVPLQLNSQSPSDTEISFQHIHDPGEVDKLGYFLLMDHLSGHTTISPFSPETLLAKFPIYLDAAIKAKTLMKDVDIALASIRSELSVDYSQNLPRLKMIIQKGNPREGPFSIFSVTFPINVKMYPDEKIVPEVEHMKWDKIEKEIILDAMKKIEPGKYYLRRMINAARAV